MTIDDLVSLTKAGFTKDDITRFLTPAPAPETPAPETPAPAPETPAPAPETPAPAPETPATTDGADLKALFENYLQQMQGTLKAFQAGNIRTDGQPPKPAENPFIKYLP